MGLTYWGNGLGDISFGLLTGLKPLEIATNAYGLRLGFLPGGVNPRNVTETNAVEHFRFFDGPGGERFILTVKGAEGHGVGVRAVFHGLYILRLFPGFPKCVDPWD